MRYRNAQYHQLVTAVRTSNLSNIYHIKTALCFRRGSWRPIGHMRPSSPLLDSVRDQFEDYDQLAKDFTRMFVNNEENSINNASLFDVVFLVGQSKQKTKLIGVRAILGVRSRWVSFSALGNSLLLVSRFLSESALVAQFISIPTEQEALFSAVESVHLP